MKLQDFMIRNVIHIAPTESIATAAKIMLEAAVGCLVATVSQDVKGIITDRDLLACLAQKHDPYLCPVSAHMSHPVTVLRPDEEAAIASAVMRARRIKRLPVAKSGKLLGIVSLSDLAALASEEAKKLGSALDFFTDVVQAQSAQHNLLRETPGHEAASPVASFAATNNRNEMSDAGGPG